MTGREEPSQAKPSGDQAKARGCATPDCPWDALAGRDYCWDCAYYRSLPKWRQRFNILRPAGVPYLLMVLVGLMMVANYAPSAKTLMACQPKPACIAQEGFSAVLLVVGLGFFVYYAASAFYRQFFGRDDIVDPEPPPGP